MARPRRVGPPPLRARDKAPSETEEKYGLLELLAIAGAKVYSLSQPGMTGQTNGLPDLLAFVPAPDQRVLMVWIEAKKQIGATVYPEQSAFQLLCKLAGVEHIMGGEKEVGDWLVARGCLLSGRAITPLIDTSAPFAAMFPGGAADLFACLKPTPLSPAAKKYLAARARLR